MRFQLADSIPDVNFWSSQAASDAPFSSHAKLRFLAIVEVEKIPLYIALGPSLQVSTNNEDTSNWFNETLLAQKESFDQDGKAVDFWWKRFQRQSDYGILLKVEGQVSQKKAGYQATEILLYATATPKNASLPAAPTLSSTEHDEQSSTEPQNEDDLKLELYALPLSSDIITHARQASGLYSPPLEAEDGQLKGRFLPDFSADQSRRAKRQKISSLFEDATKQRKRKSRGGESVAQAMAGLDGPTSQQGLPSVPPPDKNEPLQDTKAGPAKRSSLSRASTVGSFASLDSQRPVSRSGVLANGKRSSLHRVESATYPREGSLASDPDNGFAEQNKSALTKIVMAGMRMHGLQQKKKPTKNLPKSNTTASAPATDATLDADDEYKLVYHQTFKASMFTFRAHVNVKLIGQEVMRDVVDRLLEMFCTDPLLVNDFDNAFAAGFGSSQPDQGNAFDLPSESNPFVAAEKEHSTPSVKRRRLDL